MNPRVNEVFEVNKIVDDPRFEGLAIDSCPSILGRDSLDEDLIPGFADSETNPNWKQPCLTHQWHTPFARGRVADFNDYPCVDMILPAFSERAVIALRDLLEPNGEVLPLATKSNAKYFLFNILTVSDALDRSASKCHFWCNPPTTATDIDHFAFNTRKLQGLSIFRIRELPSSVLATNIFVERVNSSGLKGFRFSKVWPLPSEVNWRMQGHGQVEATKTLTLQSLVLILAANDMARHSDTISVFEDTVDAALHPTSLTAEYFGTYSGHERFMNEYRMFLTCPDADRLLEHLRGEIKSLQWPSRVRVIRRYGHMHDPDAKEECDVI